MRADVTGRWLGVLLAGMLLLHPGWALSAQISAQPGDNLPELVAGMQDGDELLLAPGNYVGGIVIEGRSIAVTGPRTGTAVITAPEQTNVLIGVLAGGEIQVERLTFAPSDAAPLGLYVQNAAATCIDCVFADTPGSPIYAEAGSLTLTRGRIERVAGDGIVAVQGSTLAITGTTISGVTGTAIATADAASVDLVDLAVEEGGVLMTGGSGAARMEGNRIHSPTRDWAVQVQGGVELVLTGNRFEAAGTAVLALLDGGALTMRGTTAIGGNGSLYVEARAGSPAVAIDDNVLLATGGGAAALRLLGEMAATITGNMVLSADVGLFVERKAKAGLDGNTIVGSYGVGIPESEPGTASLTDDLIVAGTPYSEGLAAEGGTTRLLAAIAADDALADAMRADLAIVLGAGTIADPAALGRLADAAGKLRDVAAALTTIGLKVTDAAGREEPAPFVVLDTSEAVIAQSADGTPVAIPPGPYEIAAAFEPGATTPVELAAGDSRTARLAVPRSLWVPLTYAGEGSPMLVLFRAMPPEFTQRLAGANGYDWRLETIRAFPRADATPTDIAQALELAREAVAKLPEVPVDQLDGLWERTAGARIEARRIIAAFGTAADAELLLDAAMGVWDDDQAAAVAAAYLEARLGRLSDGAVHAQLGSDEPKRAFAAAIALDAFGDPQARDRLLGWIGDPAVERQDQIVYQLRGLAAPAVTAAYRGRLADFVARQSDAKPPYMPYDALAHLVAFGTDEDWRLMGKAVAFVAPNTSRWVAEQLIPLDVDPEPLIDIVASYVDNDPSQSLAQLCPLLRLRGAGAFARLNQLSQERTNAWWQLARQSRDNFVQYYLEAGGCWPNREAAQYYHTGESELADAYFALPWMPEPWHAAELLDGEAKGTLNARYFDLVGFLAPQDLAAALATLAEPTKLTDPDLRLAYRKVLTRAGYYDRLHAFEDGLERRPYLLRHANAPDYSGAISGMVTVDPQLGADGDLTIRVRIDQVPYYHGCCDLASTIANNNNLSAWLHAPYLVDGGSKLVTAIRLTRFGEDVPLVVTGPHARGYRIAAGPSPQDYAGLVLTVELELFGDRRSLVYDLFAGAKARGFGAD